MEHGDGLRLLRRPAEQTSVPQTLGARGVVLHVVVDVVGEPDDGDAAELVSDGHGVVVEHAGGGHPPGRRVVREDDQLVLLSFVLDEVDALLDVGHDDAVSHGLDVNHQIRNVLL